MSQATLRDVTLKTVANYSRAAEYAIDCYRAGGHRLISAMQEGVERATVRGSEYLVPRMVNVMRQASQQFGSFAEKGLDAISDQTERALELGKAGMTAQVERVASLTDQIDNRIVVGGLEAAVRLSMPGAKAALKLSERVAARAEQAHDKVATVKPARRRKTKATATVAATATKSVRRAATTVKRKARKVVAEVAPAKAPRRRRVAPVEVSAAPATETAE